MADIASYARQLAAEFTDPDSARNARWRQGRSIDAWAADYAPGPGDSLPYPKTTYDINCGHCEEFAYMLEQRFPGGEMLTLDDLALREDPRADTDNLPGHYVYSYQGRLYDAQNPDGVDDWRKLDVVRYGGHVTRAEYLRGRGLAEAVVDQLLESSGSALDQALLEAEVPEEALRRHVRKTNPHADYARNANYQVPFSLYRWHGPEQVSVNDPRLPAKSGRCRRDINRYVKMAKAGSPIPALVLSDENGRLVIHDGAHRLAAARKAGLASVSAYIGIRKQ